MNPLLAFVEANGYLILFLVVAAEQLGMPLPAIPVLVAVGALAHAGQASLAVSLFLAILAASLGDAVWFSFGRTKGQSVFAFLCKVSPDRHRCERRAQHAFDKYGAVTLVFAKFIPGFSTVAPAIAGASKFSWLRFLAFDGAGSLIWAGLPLSAGFWFGDQFNRLWNRIESMGNWALVLGAIGTAAYLIVRTIRKPMNHPPQSNLEAQP